MVSAWAAVKKCWFVGLVVGTLAMMPDVSWAQRGGAGGGAGGGVLNPVLPSIPPLRGQPVTQRPSDTGINVPGSPVSYPRNVIGFIAAPVAAMPDKPTIGPLISSQ